jgi:hypothetical protein
MATLDQIRRDLDEQRRGLLAQLAAVESAIAALAGVDALPQIEAPPGVDPDVDPQPGAVVPTRVKPKRELSEAHKDKLVASSRRAREVKDAAKGIARELHDDSFVPAIGKRGDRQLPRLVKRNKA